MIFTCSITISLKGLSVSRAGLEFSGEGAERGAEDWAMRAWSVEWVGKAGTLKHFMTNCHITHNSTSLVHSKTFHSITFSFCYWESTVKIMRRWSGYMGIRESRTIIVLLHSQTKWNANLIALHSPYLDTLVTIIMSQFPQQLENCVIPPLPSAQLTSQRA